MRNLQVIFTVRHLNNEKKSLMTAATITGGFGQLDRLAFTLTAAPSGGHPGHPCSTHLVLSDLTGRDVGAQLLQWVDDLVPWADRDHAVEDSVQRVDTGILGGEDRLTVSQPPTRGGGGGSLGATTQGWERT